MIDFKGKTCPTRKKTSVLNTFFSAALLVLPLTTSQHAFAAEGPVLTKSYFTVQSDAALKSTLPKQILERGFITAGTNPTTPPTVFFLQDNKTLVGREIDMMTAIGERLGVKVKWYDAGSFDNIIPGLKSGRYDVALSNIRATQKRFSQIDFISYFDASRQAVIARKDANITPFTELTALCGKSLSTGAGTGQIELINAQNKACIAEGKKPINNTIFPNRTAGVQAVISGRVPMYYGPWEGLAWQVAQLKDLTISGQINVKEAPMSIALAKGSPIETSVQAALNSLIKDGTYQQILDKWSIGYGALSEAKLNQAVFTP